jgi:hypothetical protein
MSYIKRRGSIIVGTVMLSYMGVNHAWAEKAEEEAQQHSSEYISEDVVESPQIRWDIIGTHTGGALNSEKFIQPTKACEGFKAKNVDYLLQLQLCAQERKGWLKI